LQLRLRKKPGKILLQQRNAQKGTKKIMGSRFDVLRWYWCRHWHIDSAKVAFGHQVYSCLCL
jgi:hypothetical protein